MTMRWTALAAPARFYRAAGLVLPWLWIAALVLGAAGLYVGFAVAPTDAVQGEAYRILYIHVPAAWMSMIVYLAMALWAAIGWAFNARMAAVLSRALAPTGAMLTAIALVTGSLWGRPTWGTWWVWDARLTSELILLLLYMGTIALANAFDDVRRGDRAAALLAVVGAINVPIIYGSVYWWNTLHQGATIRIDAAPSMDAPMLLGLLLTTLAFWAYAFAAVLSRARAMLIEREADAQWVRTLSEAGA